MGDNRSYSSTNPLNVALSPYQCANQTNFFFPASPADIQNRENPDAEKDGSNPFFQQEYELNKWNQYPYYPQHNTMQAYSSPEQAYINQQYMSPLVGMQYVQGIGIPQATWGTQGYAPAYNMPNNNQTRPQPTYITGIARPITSTLCQPQDPNHLPQPLGPKPKASQQYSHSKLYPPWSAGDMVAGIRVKRLEMHFRYGIPGQFPGLLSGPNGFAYGGVNHNYLFIADTHNHRIVMFDLHDNTHMRMVGHHGHMDGNLNYPSNVAWDHISGNLLIIDRSVYQARLQSFTIDGLFVDVIARPFYHKHSQSMIISDDGKIHWLRRAPASIMVINKNRSEMRQFSLGSGQDEVSAFTIHDDKYYVCSVRDHSVKEYSMSGKYFRAFGKAGLTDYPIGVAFTSCHRLMVCHSHGNTVHLVLFALYPEPKPVALYHFPNMKGRRSADLQILPNGCILTLTRDGNEVFSFKPLPYEQENVMEKFTVMSEMASNASASSHSMETSSQARSSSNNSNGY